jgi:hypothetical protein
MAVAVVIVVMMVMAVIMPVMPMMTMGMPMMMPAMNLVNVTHLGLVDSGHPPSASRRGRDLRKQNRQQCADGQEQFTHVILHTRDAKRPAVF